MGSVKRCWAFCRCSINDCSIKSCFYLHGKVMHFLVYTSAGPLDEWEGEEVAGRSWQEGEGWPQALGWEQMPAGSQGQTPT